MVTKKMGITTLKDFVLRNINKLEDGKRKSAKHIEYVPTKLIREEYANLLDTTFIVMIEKIEGSKKPTKHLKKLDAKEWLKSQADIYELPKIYEKLSEETK